MSLHASYMCHDSDDLDMCEYVTKVKWVVKKKREYALISKPGLTNKCILSLFFDHPFDFSHILTHIKIVGVVTHIAGMERHLFQSFVSDTKIAGWDGWSSHFPNSNIAFHPLGHWQHRLQSQPDRPANSFQLELRNRVG